MKKAFFWVLAVSLISIAGNVGADQPTEEGRFVGRNPVPIDFAAFKQMSREERRAAIRAYKAARSEEAQRLGIKVTSDRQFIRLDPPRRTFNGVPLSEGTRISYDSGDVVGIAGAAGRMVGNRFDSALNPAGTACCFPVGRNDAGLTAGFQGSASITMITFDMVNAFFNTVIWSLYSDISGTQAKQVTAVPRKVRVGLNTLSVKSPTTLNAYANGSFLAGIWQHSLKSTGLGIDTGTVGGQGFHAISINDGTIGTGLANVTTGDGNGANAVFRVSGNVATPVELMSFSIED